MDIESSTQPTSAAGIRPSWSPATTEHGGPRARCRVGPAGSPTSCEPDGGVVGDALGMVVRYVSNAGSDPVA
jgi:hypothetical protein